MVVFTGRGPPLRFCSLLCLSTSTNFFARVHYLLSCCHLEGGKVRLLCFLSATPSLFLAADAACTCLDGRATAVFLAMFELFAVCACVPACVPVSTAKERRFPSRARIGVGTRGLIDPQSYHHDTLIENLSRHRPRALRHVPVAFHPSGSDGAMILSAAASAPRPGPTRVWSTWSTGERSCGWCTRPCGRGGCSAAVISRSLSPAASRLLARYDTLCCVCGVDVHRGWSEVSRTLLCFSYVGWCRRTRSFFTIEPALVLTELGCCSVYCVNAAQDAAHLSARFSKSGGKMKTKRESMFPSELAVRVNGRRDCVRR